MEIMENYTLSKTDHDYIAFKEARNKLRHLTRNLRIPYVQHNVSNIGMNPRSFWHYINSHMKLRSGVDSIQHPEVLQSPLIRRSLNYYHILQVFSQPDET